MTRSDLEKVWDALMLTDRSTNVHNAAKAIIEAELAKPEAREWGVQYNDEFEPAPGIYRMSEHEVRSIAVGDSRRRIFTRTPAHQVPAGPWERAE